MRKTDIDNQSHAAPATTPRIRTAVWRSPNGRLWIAQVVLAVGFALAAAAKLSDDPQALATFADLGIDASGMHLIGALEIAGAIGLLVPRLCGLAAAAFVALMFGAVLATLLTVGAVAAIAPAAFLALDAVVAWKRRDRTAQFVAFVVGPVGEPG